MVRYIPVTSAIVRYGWSDDEIKDPEKSCSLFGPALSFHSPSYLPSFFSRPLSPSKVLSSTAIKLNWVVLKNLKYIEGFHIKYRKTGAREFKTLTVADNNAITFILRSLDEFHMYEMRIQPFYFTITGGSSF